MRAGAIAKVLSIAALAAAAGLGLAAFFSFRAALSARIDRAASIEAAAVRPAAAARLAAELLAHRLALVPGDESRAVAGALRRTAGEDALERYRRAGGNPALLEEARRALAAASPDPAGDVAFLRAIRGLEKEASETPSPARPEAPVPAGKAGSLLAGAGAAAAAAALLAYAAGRSRRAP